MISQITLIYEITGKYFMGRIPRMLCVMYVKDGNEKRAEGFINGLLGKENGDVCFHLTRQRRKKYGGKWQTVEEPLLPGYVFIATDAPEQLYGKLKKVHMYAAALESREADFIEKITGTGSKTGEIALSFIRIAENGETEVLSGPLLFMKDWVRRMDFHRRVAEVETDFMGEKRRLYLGVEFEDAVGC